MGPAPATGDARGDRVLAMHLTARHPRTGELLSTVRIPGADPRRRP
ncbi:hypothetical protein SFR_3192 [Streptomyces sp. FR-008]|nr:hypothetical protein SFR_3192 [Streptomyces sp. FR-008]